MDALACARKPPLFSPMAGRAFLGVVGRSSRMPSPLPDYDVIVVGGGPAGSVCARLLGDKGARVLLVDKEAFPREKVCGDAISGKAVKVLQSMGLHSKLELKPHAKVRGAIFSSPNAAQFTVRIPRTSEDKYSYCVRREIFDNVLFEHATKVCAFREKVQVTGLRTDGTFRYVKLADLSTKESKEVSCYVVVGADGATSAIAKSMGANELPAEHGCVAVRGYYENVNGLSDNIEIHFVDELVPGYFWIFPLENGMANVGVGMVLSEMQKKHVILPEVLEKILSSPRFAPRFADAKRKGNVMGWTLPFGSFPRPIAYDGVVLVGDAAALIDPFTGEGIGNAMISAQLASETITSALEQKNYTKEFLSTYEKSVRATLGPELETSYKLQKWTQYKPILNFGFGKAARNPKVAAFISSMLLEENPRKEMMKPVNVIKLLLS